MNNKVNSVLNSIEKIDNLIMEADVSVSDAMSDVYSKQFKMEGNVTEDYINHEYYQESVIAGILIGGGIIAVLATAIVLITKHVKKSASGDPEKKNDTSTAAGVSLDKPEEFNKKVEQLKSELEKAGGKLTISDVGFDASKLKQKYEMIKELCGYAETFLKGTEDDEINGALTQFNDKLTEINGINYKLSGEVDVTPASLDEIKSLAGPIQQMTANLEKVSKEFEKRSKENKNANTGEMDDAKKERFEKLKEGLNQINKGSTALGKSVDDEFSIIRKYFEAVSKAAKEKDKPAQAESEKKSESEKSQETPQNPDILKQKISPITAKWAAMNGNSDSKHPGAKLTADEAYNIISSIHTDVMNHRGPIALNTLKAKANEDPTKAMLIKNLIEATIDNKDVFNTEDEETINDIKSGLPELETIAANAPSEEPKKDETKPESEEPKEGTNESGEKITISKDGGALYDLITSWSNIEEFKHALNYGNAIISGMIDRSYNNELLLTNTGKVERTSTKFEITFGSEEEKRLISSFLNILDNFLNNEELFNKIPPELQKKLIGAFDMFLKRNEPLFPGNINLENNNFGWLDIKNGINKLKEKYAGSKETKSDETSTKSLPTVSELINDVDNVDKIVEAYNQTASSSDKIDSGDIPSFKNAQNQIKIDNLEDIFNEFIKIYNIDLNMPISKSVFKTLASVSEDVNSCHGFESNLNDSFLSIRYEKYQNNPSRKQQMFDEAKTYAEMRGINVTLTKPDGTQVEVGTKSEVKSTTDDTKPKTLRWFLENPETSIDYVNKNLFPKDVSDIEPIEKFYKDAMILIKNNNLIDVIEKYGEDSGRYKLDNELTWSGANKLVTDTYTLKEIYLKRGNIRGNINEYLQNAYLLSMGEFLKDKIFKIAKIYVELHGGANELLKPDGTMVPVTPAKTTPQPEPKADETKSDETKSGETTNTPPVENKEGDTKQLSENDQKLQVAFEQLESKLEQIQQKYPNGLSTIGIATGCDPRTFSAVILTQFIENKSEAEIKAFSNNLMDCLRGGFFRNKSQTHAKVNSQLPAPCKEAIDVMQIMINDGYEVGNSLMGTNYTPDNLSKYKGYMYKGNLINKLMKITPENVLTDDVFNDVKLGNPENTETPEEPSPEETTPEKDPETPVTNSRPKMEFALKNPGAAVDYVNQHPTSSDKSNEIPEDRKNKLIEAVDAGLSDVIIEYNNSIMIGIDFDEDELTRLDVSVLIMQAIIVLQINELRNDIGGFLKQFYAKYANDNSMSRRNTAFGLAKAYAKIKGLTVDIPSPEGKIITVTPSSDQTDTDKPEQELPKNVIDKSSVDEYLDKLKNGSINKDSTAAADFAEKQKQLGSVESPNPEETTIDKKMTTKYLNKLKNNRLTTSDAKDFAKKQKHLGRLGFNPPKIEEEKPDNEVDDTKSNVASYESPYKSPDVMYDDTFTGNTNSDIETMLNNRMYGADKDEHQQIASDTIQNKLNRLNLGNDDTEETVSLEELKNLPSLMSDAVSGKLTDDGAKKLASNIMQLKLAIVWPTDVIEANNVDYATDITKKILSDCDTVSSSGDQNTIEQMKSDIVNVQKNPETEITSTPEEALNKIVDLTGKVTNLIKSAAVNGANNISVALNSTKRFVSEVVLPGMHTAASMGSNAATNTIEKAKSLVTMINDHLTGSITSSPISNDNTVQSATPSTENADTTKEPSTTRVKYDSDIMFMPAAPVNIFKNVPDLGSMDATQVLSELFNTFDYINKPTGSKYYRNHEDTDFTQGDLDFINSIRGQGGSLPLRKKSELASNSGTLVNYLNSIYSMLKTIGGNNAMNRYNPTSKKLVVDIATTLEQYLGYVQAELEESYKDVLNAATPMMNKVLDECERIKNIK